MVADKPGTLLDRWMAYARIEPFGVARGDLQAGMVCATLRNLWSAHCQEVGDAQPSDYLLTFGEGEEREPPSVEELEAKMNVWASAVNARMSE